MALVERLMGEPYVTHSQKIAVHEFFAAQVEVVGGYLTRTQVKNYYSMDAAAITEYDALVDKAPGTDAAKALWIERVHAVFLLAEERIPGYDTPANVRTKLEI